MLRPSPPGVRNGSNTIDSTLRQASWLVLALVASGVLATAAFLNPAAQGWGTHRQLGLPPCLWLELTGQKCPGCGLTTALSAALHGQWQQAWQANAAGLPLIALLVAAPPYCVYSAFKAKPLLAGLIRPGALMLGASLALWLQWLATRV